MFKLVIHAKRSKEYVWMEFNAVDMVFPFIAGFINRVASCAQHAPEKIILT